MRDTLSTDGEHPRVAEVKSFPAIPKSMRSVNGDQNGANLKKWSVLLVCTIPASKKRRRIPPQKSKITLCSEQAGGRFVTRERPAGKPRGIQLQTVTVTNSAARFAIAQAKASRYSGSVQSQSNFTESYDRLGQS